MNKGKAHARMKAIMLSETQLMMLDQLPRVNQAYSLVDEEEAQRNIVICFNSRDTSAFYTNTSNNKTKQ